MFQFITKDAKIIYFQVPKAFNGGSEAFLSLLWTSAVCDYESLASQLLCSQPPPSFTRELVAAALPGVTHSIPDLIASFLQGSGAPCPALFESLKEGFSSLIDFDKLDDPSFRPRIFLWAATGCPTIDPTSSDLITVCFYYVIRVGYYFSLCVQITIAPDDDALYADTRNRDVMLAEGKICFRTCLKAVRIPGSYIIKLASSSYPPTSPDIVFKSMVPYHLFLSAT
jgi:hypothetical protein